MKLLNPLNPKCVDLGSWNFDIMFISSGKHDSKLPRSEHFWFRAFQSFRRFRLSASCYELCSDRRNTSLRNTLASTDQIQSHAAVYLKCNLFLLGSLAGWSGIPSSHLRVRKMVRNLVIICNIYILRWWHFSLNWCLARWVYVTKR